VAYSRGRWQEKWRVERLAWDIRGQLGLDQLAVIDPWRLADAVPAHPFYPEDILDDPLRCAALRQVRWDGFGFCYPDDPTLMVLLNSGRPETRQAATLMEELCHQILRHEPSRLYVDKTTGLLRREFKRAQEDEAYDLGATILLTKELIQREVNAGRSAAEIASERRCSRQLVEYRIRRCRLWDRYLRLTG
jgi:Zn-dependent peptidase ImmA (M78 family)